MASRSPGPPDRRRSPRTREDPGAVGELIADALRPGYEHSGTVAAAIAPYAGSHGLRPGDGIGLRWLLDLTGDHQRPTWLDDAAAAATDAASEALRDHRRAAIQDS